MNPDSVGCSSSTRLGSGSAVSVDGGALKQAMRVLDSLDREEVLISSIMELLPPYAWLCLWRRWLRASYCLHRCAAAADVLHSPKLRAAAASHRVSRDMYGPWIVESDWCLLLQLLGPTGGSGVQQC